MNSQADLRPIKSYDDLMAERKRIEMNIAINKVLLQREYDSVKSEISEKVQPIVTAVHITKRIFSSLKRPSVVIAITSLLFNMITRGRKQLR